MPARRRFLAALAAAPLLFAAGHALAAPPTVEIVAMPHPPVKAALAPLREWLAQQGRKLVVKEIDSESTEGAKRMQAAGLTGHIPVLILIDGQYRVKRKDGSPVAFVNFPNQPDTPPGARGEWTIADVQAVLTERMKRR
jgi:hypothetical protein